MKFLVDSVTLTDLEGEGTQVGLGKVAKFNPNHDEKGEFSSGSSGAVTLYHGTTEEAAQKILNTEFKVTRSGMYGDGAYFSPDQNFAKRYAMDTLDGHGKILEAKLRDGVKVKNFTEKEVMDFEDSDQVKDLMKSDSISSSAALSKALENDGYGAHSVLRDNGSTFVVVHDPKHIGSVDLVKKKNQSLYLVEVDKVFKLHKAESDDETQFQADVENLMTNEWLNLPAEVRQSLLDAFTSGVDKGLSELMLTDSGLIGTLNTSANDFAADRAAELVGMTYDVDGTLIPNPDAKWAISQKTRDDLRQIISEAFEDETKLSTLEDTIKDATAFSDYRAAMVADTEATRAMVGGNLESWVQSGLVEGKTWLLSDDHDTPDECDDNDGVTVGILEPFPSGDFYSPAHPWCQCSVIAAGIRGLGEAA
jgi:hypothetical protein